MNTASAFSTAETEALERQIDLGTDSTVTFEQIWSETNQKVCTGWVRQNGYKRVCLQFPDDYLLHSNAISDSLKEALPTTKIFVLADTAYGNCCVDEIAAAHVNADSIIHFGNACRSKITRLPVLYVFPTLPIDFSQFCTQLETLKNTFREQKVTIYFDIGYHHLLEQQQENDSTVENLTKKMQEILLCQDLHIEIYPSAEDVKILDTIQTNGTSNSVGIFVGGDNSRFANLSLTTHGVQQWYIYDPSTNSLQSKNPLTANYIRRRYYYIEKCKDAQMLGLLVATLSAEGYLDVVARLQGMAKERGIKTQIISVGRINPAKLANFLEIDCFVLIGCPFNTGYDSKEYYKPLVSVFEAEMALNPAWHMRYPETYVTDFKQLLPEGRSFLPFDDQNKELEQDVSLVSGRLRNVYGAAIYSLDNTATLSEQEQTVMGPARMEVMTSNTGLQFEDRTWRGLDPALGATEPAKLQKGLKGIPIKYSHD